MVIRLPPRPSIVAVLPETRSLLSISICKDENRSKKDTVPLACPSDEQSSVPLYLFRYEIRPFNSRRTIWGTEQLLAHENGQCAESALIQLKEVSDNEKVRRNDGLRNVI
jgi:hypothetical protein